jgi:CRISPR-associated endonuclease/helicase Cas3
MLEAGLKDPIDSSAFAPYFSEIYWRANSLDAKGIMDLLKPNMTDCGIQFRTAAKAFHIIDDKVRSYYCPTGRVGDLSQNSSH